MNPLRACALGVRATLTTPGHIPHGLSGLMADSPGPDAPRAAEAREVQLAVSTSRATIRVLGLVPGLPWRRTCLYRAAAECVARRSLGQPARLCLGARPGAGDGEVEAHAWVELAGRERPALRPEGYTTFRRAPASGE